MSQDKLQLLVSSIITSAVNFSQKDYDEVDAFEARIQQRLKLAKQYNKPTKELPLLVDALPKLKEALQEGFKAFKDPPGNHGAMLHYNQHEEDMEVYPWQVTMFELNRDGTIAILLGDDRFPTVAAALGFLAVNRVTVPVKSFTTRFIVKPSLDHEETLPPDPKYVTPRNSDGSVNAYEDGQKPGRVASSRFRGVVRTIPGFIESVTLKELKDAEDPAFLRKGERAAKLVTPMLKRVYASTVEYKTKSSKYMRNKVIYTQKILFKDFVFIARDQQIPLRDAVRYSIESGDVHVICSCPSSHFHGFEYVEKGLDALYGLPNPAAMKFPGIRNPQLRSVYCKHMSRVVEQVMRNEQAIIERFAQVYGRQTLPGVPGS